MAIKYFTKTKEEALRKARRRNNCLATKRCKDMDFVVEGPDNNWAVVDFKTAQEFGVYSF